MNALVTAAVLVATAVLPLGCVPGEVTFVGGSTGGRVRRVTLTVDVGVDPADRALVDSLGWRGGVPEATVRLLLNGTLEWLGQRTDASGRVVFENLFPGLYRIYAERTLTDAEVAAMGRVQRALGDGMTAAAGTGLALYADRPDGLVLSEAINATPFGLPADVQRAATYVEVYNNGTTAVHLDGLIFGVLPVFFFVDAPFMSCQESAPVREDSAGVYGRWLLAFPGGGTDHPVAPGETRVVAMDAIDHSAIHPELPDLSQADFEIASAGQANNPSVPDMLDIGLEPFVLSFLSPNTKLLFLLAPVAIGTLPRPFRDRRGREYIRIPASAVFDAVLLADLWPEKDLESPPCIPAVPRSLERYEGGFYELTTYSQRGPVSVQRRVLRVTPDGRKILMNTNTSAVDFVVAPRTPGWIPEP